MQIQRIQNYTYNTQFKSWSRDVYSESKNNLSRELKHRNDTFIYRDGIPYWSNLVKFINKKFKDTNKVNVYSYGCSNGSEPYTFVIEMLNKHKNDAAKYLPVTAKDYDSVAINMAKTGCLPLDPSEIMDLQISTGKGLSNFGRILSEENKIPNVFYEQSENTTLIHNKTKRVLNIPPAWYSEDKNVVLQLNPELSSHINFSTANILHDYKKIRPKNSVVFARNFWPYLEPYQITTLIEHLGKHLKQGSLVILGMFDTSVCNNWHNIDINKLFSLANFRKTEMPCVYEKMLRRLF